MPTAPYGSWRSPITADLIVSSSVGVSQPAIDGDDVYWLESRPTEGGRSVIVRRTADGSTHDINPAPLNARTRVHEYGGGDYLVHNGSVYFANFADQRLYVAHPGATPVPLTHAGLETASVPGGSAHGSEPAEEQRPDLAHPEALERPPPSDQPSSADSPSPRKERGPGERSLPTATPTSTSISPATASSASAKTTRGPRARAERGRATGARLPISSP